MLRTDTDARAATKALAAFPATFLHPVEWGPGIWHLIGLAPVVRKGTHDAAWYHLAGTGLYLYVVVDTLGGEPYAPHGVQHAMTPRWQDVRTCDDVTTLAQRQLPMTAAAQDSVNRMGKGVHDADQKAVAAALDPKLAQMWEGKRGPVIERAKRVVARAYKGRDWPWWARYHLLGEDVPAGADRADTRARTHPAAR